jgi:hypothetical protein
MRSNFALLRAASFIRIAQEKAGRTLKPEIRLSVSTVYGAAEITILKSENVPHYIARFTFIEKEGRNWV